MTPEPTPNTFNTRYRLTVPAEELPDVLLAAVSNHPDEVVSALMEPIIRQLETNGALILNPLQLGLFTASLVQHGREKTPVTWAATMQLAASAYQPQG